MRRLRHLYHRTARRYWQAIVTRQLEAGVLERDHANRYMHHLAAERSLGITP